VTASLVSYLSSKQMADHHLDQGDRRKRTKYALWCTCSVISVSPSLTIIAHRFMNRDSIAMLKGLERREGSASSSSNPRPKKSPLPSVQRAKASESRSEAEDDWRPHFADEEDDGLFQAAKAKRAKEAKLASEAKRIVAISNAREREKNKEKLNQHKETASARPKARAFVDRQESAERVTWDDSQQSNQQKSSRQKGKKRAQPPVEEEEMSDPSEDESFQQNNRPLDVRERRNIAPTAQRRTATPARKLSPRPAQPTRPSSPPDDEDVDEVQIDEDMRRQIREEVERHNRGTPAQSQPPSRSQAQIAEQQKRINQLAKNQVRARVPPKVQTRRPWSDEETSALIEYIMEHGTSYAYIKDLDGKDQNVLERRDQVALKDKARNIKTDYLK